MLAIARALMAGPRLLLLDEPSLGLAPRLVREIFRVIERINRDGVTVLLVEQNARRALALAARGYVLETGRVAVAGPSAELAGGLPRRRPAAGGDGRHRPRGALGSRLRARRAPLRHRACRPHPCREGGAARAGPRRDADRGRAG